MPHQMAFQGSDRFSLICSRLRPEEYILLIFERNESTRAILTRYGEFNQKKKSFFTPTHIQIYAEIRTFTHITVLHT